MNEQRILRTYAGLVVITADELTWRILNGGDNMPAFGTALTPDQLAALVAFLETRTGQTRTGAAA